MNILIMGGTRYFGVHMVSELLKNGHEITLATRGNTKDPFGEKVHRLYFDRTNKEEVHHALHGKSFDVICDNIAYSSNEVEYLLSTVSCKKYILTSTMSVYKKMSLDTKEEEFSPLEHELILCDRTDFPYDEIKRQAECVLLQKYSNIASAVVRFPFVIGEDDYTNRLYFYVEHVVNGLPMHIDNTKEQIGFIHSIDAGKFLAWVAQSDVTGIYNAYNERTFSLQEIIDYVSKKMNQCAIISTDGEASPYNGVKSYSLNIDRAKKIGYSFPTADTYMYELLDSYIARAIESR